jgi:hypothetical protein
MSWSILLGVVEWWADEERRDAGRGTTTSGATIDHVRAAFVAQRSPWRLSEVTLDTTNPDVTPAIASWADAATAVLRGTPAQQHVVGANESWGDLCLRSLLLPTALEALLPKPWPSEFHVPGELLERDVSVLPDLISLGTDHYEVSYDPDLDTITAWTALIDGTPAQRVTLSNITSLT